MVAWVNDLRVGKRLGSKRADGQWTAAGQGFARRPAADAPQRGVWAGFRGPKTQTCYPPP